MPAWRREADALIADELGSCERSWMEWDALAPAPSDRVAVLVVSMVGHRAPSEERLPGLAAIAARLATGARLVVVDHNRPRQSFAALLALGRAPWVPGGSPAARWRRLAHPTAREVQAAGFRVDRLRLAAGERVQIVVATRT